jgi:hypothetical protein
VLSGNVLGLTPVIVYQMGKVGSMSIFATLQGSGLPVFHVHRMRAEYLARTLEERRALGWNVPPINAHQGMGLTVHSKVIAAGRRAKIVTLVRDPIARNLSGYFYSLDRIWNIANAHDAISIDDLCRGFLKRFTHDEPLTWFDDEFHPVLGIDVYAHPFLAQGHTTIHTDQVDVLIMRSELKRFGAGRLPIFGGPFYLGNSMPQSTNGAPDPNLYADFATPTPKRKYAQMDFAWSFACANNIGSNSNPCVSTHTIN